MPSVNKKSREYFGGEVPIGKACQVGALGALDQVVVGTPSVLGGECPGDNCFAATLGETQ
jgi:hypothetical protein